MEYKEIIIAVISVVGVIITAVAALWQFRREQWTKNITAERVEWLKTFRDEVGKIFVCLEMLANDGCIFENGDIKIADCIYEAEKARHTLYTRLRSMPTEKNEHNDYVKEFLLEIEFNKEYAEKFFDDSNELVKIKESINSILEREWDKVKIEAKKIYVGNRKNEKYREAYDKALEEFNRTEKNSSNTAKKKSPDEQATEYNTKLVDLAKASAKRKKENN